MEGMCPLHADELPITTALVRRLVDDQFPEFSGHRLKRVRASGSTNVLHRLGHDKVVRLPRQPGGSAGIEKESRWLPFVAQGVSIEVPSVEHVGQPSPEFGEEWSITTWIRGRRPGAARGPEHGQGTETLARDIAQFVAELRRMDVPERALSDESLQGYRGLPLIKLDSDFRQALAECRGLDLALDLDAAVQVWDQAVEASVSLDAERAWFHGDLLAENLLVDSTGGLRAVLDFDGLGIGDPTVDLVVAWEVLDEAGRAVFRRDLDIDDPTWLVSRGWALFIAMITFPYYGESKPLRCADRLAMAQAAIRGD